MDDLLQPVLGKEERPRALYSSRALFFTAFFGGPLGVAGLSALNSRILHRLKADAWFYVLAPVALFVFYYLVIQAPEGAEGYKWMGEFRRENPVYKFGPRALALVFWAASYALHRKFHKAMRFSDMHPLRPWAPAIVCVLAGGAVQIGMIFAVLKIQGVI